MPNLFENNEAGIVTREDFEKAKQLNDARKLVETQYNKVQEIVRECISSESNVLLDDDQVDEATREVSKHIMDIFYPG